VFDGTTHISEVMVMRNTRITRASHGHWVRWSVMSRICDNYWIPHSILPQVARWTTTSRPI